MTVYESKQKTFYTSAVTLLSNIYKILLRREEPWTEFESESRRVLDGKIRLF